MAFDVEAAYRRFGPMVRRRCARLLRDDDAARDAAQEVFVLCLVHQDRLTQDATSRLLWTIATRVCLSKLRTKKRRPEDAPSLLDAIAGADDTERAVFVRRLLDAVFAREGDALRADTRTLAVLHYVDGFTLEETASAAGMSVSGVRKRLRALQERVAGLRDPATGAA